jgi:hypothetical protein
MKTRPRLKPVLSASPRAFHQTDWASYALRLEAGRRGRMDNEPYEPLIGASTPTIGYATRMHDPMTDGCQTCLSNAESDVVRDHFYRPGYQRSFTQVALDRPSTMKIADLYKLLHPTYPDKKTPLIMSTDHVAIFEIDGVQTIIASSIKSSRHLDQRDQVYAQIERLYWEDKGVFFERRFRDQVSKARNRTVRWIDKFHRRFRHLPFPHRWPETEAALYSLLSQGSVLNAACHEVDGVFGLKDVCLTHARFFIGSGIWLIDFDQLINPFAPLTIVERNIPGV